jgi:branched-chain amino acid transport system ATP-binding protein
MLSINNIEVIYLKVILVLKGVSLKVDDGSIVALMGANGAGKSTTLKAISGLLVTEEGEITDGNIDFGGQRIDRMMADAIVRAGIVQVMEGRRIFGHLSTEENLLIGAILRKNRGEVKRDLGSVYRYFPKLKRLRNNTCGYLSGGEQQMVLIGSALMAKPKVMLLDEPSLGLAPIMVREIFDIIRRIRIEQMTSILLVEQNAKVALGIADYGYIMENGRIVLDGPSEKLASNEDVKEFYLGLSNVGERKSFREIKHYKRRKRWLS